VDGDEVTDRERLVAYVRLIDDFLGGRTPTQEFTNTYFKAFQDDPTIWSQQGEALYDALNDVQLACEAWSPEPTHLSEFDVTEAELREICERRIAELRRFVA
jgi:hypothetical protein